MKGNEKIVIEYELDEPPATIWSALTVPKLLAAWLMENDIKPVVGHTFQFRAEPQGDWNGIVDCEVLEVIPEKLLSYTWNGGSARNNGYEHKLETVVRWTLQPGNNGGTTLTLVHEGFEPDDFAFRVMSQGWKGKGPAIARAAQLVS